MSDSKIVNTTLMELLFLLIFVFFLAAASLYEELENVPSMEGEKISAEPKEQPVKDVVKRNLKKELEDAEERIGDLIATAPGYFACFPKEPEEGPERQYAYRMTVEQNTVRVEDPWEDRLSATSRQKMMALPAAMRDIPDDAVDDDTFKEWARGLANRLASDGNPFDKKCRLWVRVEVSDAIESDAERVEGGASPGFSGMERRIVDLDQFFDRHFYRTNNELKYVLTRYVSDD